MHQAGAAAHHDLTQREACAATTARDACVLTNLADGGQRQPLSPPPSDLRSTRLGRSLRPGLRRVLREVKPVQIPSHILEHLGRTAA